MSRANRYYIPGYVWHITHRCHQEEYLLKFARDRRRWIHWLFEAKKRFGLCVLNYMVTSNHIHLLVYDNSGKGVIPKSMQLISARTGQEYNNRKQRKGAFWEDRYHATAVEKNSHLQRCLIYIDLNMVRAGVVDHPMMWPFCGYNEIQNPPGRYRIIDLDCLARCTGFTDLHHLQAAHYRWVESSLQGNETERQGRWSDSIAVGSKSFIKEVKMKLEVKAKWRSVKGSHDDYELKETVSNFGNISTQGFESITGTPSQAVNTFP